MSPQETGVPENWKLRNEWQVAEFQWQATEFQWRVAEFQRQVTHSPGDYRHRQWRRCFRVLAQFCRSRFSFHSEASRTRSVSRAPCLSCPPHGPGRCSQRPKQVVLWSNHISGKKNVVNCKKKCKKHKSCAVHIISTISHQRNAVKISRTHM